MGAAAERLGCDADKALEVLKDHGIRRTLAKEAVQLAEANGGGFTVFAIVDALTRVAGRMKYAGDRVEADEKAGQLLTLVA